MKKGLSLLLAASVAFSAFSATAFAATPQTAEEKYEALVEAGIFEGFPDGEAHLEDPMTRAQAAKIVALVLGLDLNEDAASVYTDLADAKWAAGFIGAATEAGILNGRGNGIFDPSANVSVQELAKIMVEALDIEVDATATVEGADEWAQAYVAAAVAAKLIPAQDDYTAPASRTILVEASYSAYTTVPQTGDLKISSIAQSGVKSITVNFNKAVTEAEKANLKFDVKFGLVPYTVTAKYSDDNKSVVLSNSFNFPSGDYTVTVGSFEAQTIKIEQEKVSKVEIGATQLQNTTGQKIQAKAYNQFGEEVASPGLTISVFGPSFSASTDTVDLSSLKVDDSVVVTVSHPATGLSTSKTFKLVAASTITSMTFGPVAPKANKQWITTGETDLKVAYTLVDQYGNNVKLPASTSAVANGTASVIGDVYFYTNNENIVNPDNFTVNADGELLLDAGNTAGTAVITAVNNKSGASTFFSVEVKAASKLKGFTISHPGVLVAANEDVKMPFVATDSFDQPIVGKDIRTYTAAPSQVTFTSSNPSVTIASHSFDATTGDLKMKFAGHGSTTIYAWVGGLIASSVTLEVKEEAFPVKVTATSAATKIAQGAEVELKKGNLTVVDTYGRTIDYTTKGYNIKLAVKDNTTNVVTVSNSTYKVTAVGEGSKTIVVSLVNASNVDVANSAFEYTTEVVKTSAVVSYELAAVADLYRGTADGAFANAAAAGDYAKALELTGKDASGNKVAINASTIVTALTSSDLNVVGTDLATLKVFGKKKGTSTVAVWQGATKLAEVAINVSDAASVAASAKFKEATYTLSGAVGATLDLDPATSQLEVKDQYGVVIANNGVWASSDTSKATVDQNGVVTKVAAGEVTISFVTANGVVASTKVVVE